MGTTLTNGVYLPNEGERNCYAGLKTNWEILDQKVADVTALQQAVAGALHREIVESLPTTDINPNTIYMILSGTSATENVYNEFMYVNNAWELIGTSATDLTNYYTKAEVDGKLLLKANASDLTSHTGDTTIHVTASDKTKWTNSANTVVLRLAKTALTPSSSTNAFSNLDDATALKVGDKVMDTAGVLFEVTAIDTANSTFTIGTSLIDLANDSDVVHKSGNESVSGKKNFKDLLTTQPDGTLWPNVSNTSDDITLLGKNVFHAEQLSSGKLTDLSAGAWNVVELGIGCFLFRTNSGTDIRYKHLENGTVNRICVVSGANRFINDVSPNQDNTYDLGSSTLRWRSINDLNPGCLSMPDLANGIDISSYITHLDKVVNNYTPPSNGWLSIRVKKTSLAHASLMMYQTGGLLSSYETTEFGISGTNLPVIANQNVEIYIIADSLASAKFYPCLGNV